MAHYTTMLRSYLETLAGFTEEQDFEKIDMIIGKTHSKVFTKEYELFDESYKPVIESKILYHYYMREIGFETVGLWKYHMNRTMNEIMPYYSKLYESAALKYNPLFDADYTREGQREGTEDSKHDTHATGADNTTAHSGGTIKDNGGNSNNQKDRFSDTPQNGLAQVEQNQYLTTYRNVTDEGTNNNTRTLDTTDTSHSDSTNDSQTTGDIDTTEKWVEHIVGKQGSGSYANLVKEYRDTLLNIDALVINCFEQCFFGLV